MGNWNCFICGEELKGPHKVIYCVPEHHTKEQLAEAAGIIGKVVDYIGGPSKKADIKIEQGKKFGVLDRFIGVSPNTKRYTRWREVPKPKQRMWYDCFFGMPNVYECHLHVTCYEKCKHPDDKRRLEENMFHGFRPPA